MAEVLDAADERFPELGTTLREIRNHLEFGWEEYSEITGYCRERGIEFLCTGFDVQAVDFLERLGVNGYKLASHSLTNLPLLEYVADIGKPTILSTGMAEWDDVDRAVAVFARRSAPLTLLHCVSAYPTPIEESNLALIAALRERYGLPVGYSGHEFGTLPSLVAVALGAVSYTHLTLPTIYPV